MELQTNRQKEENDKLVQTIKEQREHATLQIEVLVKTVKDQRLQAEEEEKKLINERAEKEKAENRVKSLENTVEEDKEIISTQQNVQLGTTALLIATVCAFFLRP